MLIPLDQVLERYGGRTPIRGVLHLGAHVGEEAAAYEAAGLSRVVWVEALPATVTELRRRVEPLGHEVIEAAVSDRAGQEVNFFIASNGQSSSLLQPKTHLVVSPEIAFEDEIRLVTTTVDELSRAHDFSELNMLNADLQGAELLALRGAERTLEQMELLYLEINTKELYEGCARLPELDAFLHEKGFCRVALRMAGRRLGWGDGVWAREEGVSRLRRLRSGFQRARFARSRLGHPGQERQG